MTFATNTLRVILVIAGVALLLSVMPIYSEPFGGCRVSGFGTFQLGCTLWLDALIGFILVVWVGCVGSSRSWSLVWGLAIVMALGAVGGLSGFKTGAYLYALSQPTSMAFYWKGAGVATILGGAVALVVFSILSLPRKSTK